MSTIKQHNFFQCLNFNDVNFSKEVNSRRDELNLEIHDDIIFLYLENDDSINRLLLRKILNMHKNSNFVLVSDNKGIAFLAWKSNVMSFLFYNTGNFIASWQSLLNRIQKYPPKIAEAPEKLKINFKGGFDLVNIDDICFCIGDGSYTHIYLQNGIKKCLSYPLNKIEKRLEKIPYLNRIGKSFIVNFNRIKSVKTDKLIFSGIKEIDLKLGKTYITRIKQNLLWY